MMALSPGNIQQETGHSSVIAQHYNQLEEKGRAARVESRIFYLRNFNNWIKSMLIGEFLQKVKEDKGRETEINVLDIGAGKGGDLLKWKKGNISHLICADIAGTSMEQCQQRYRDMINRNRRQRDRGRCFTAEFITADCTKVNLKEKYNDPNIKFDISSIQFSFHYCFESLAQAECMIQNAAECLQPGGYLIGTTPDANDIVRRLKEAEGLSFGNDIFSVTCESKDNFPIFGAKYDFHLEGVVDCPEFLVYFPAVEKIAEENGLKLVYKKRFEEFFHENKTSENGRTLLSKMRALETYPPVPNTEAMSTNPLDYEHAQKILSGINDGKQNNQECRVGTLSKAEWEAVSLYLVFAFMKVNSSNEENNSPHSSEPEYS